VALAAHAHGVHLRGDSMPASRARRIAPPGFVIGRSVHSIDEADRAAGDGADYVVFGPVWRTPSKPGHPGAGVQALAEVARATPLPVLAVGGLTAETASEAVRAGASGYAAISLFDTLGPLT
jgi:thiamine-phosphate diphosphorylase